MYHLKQMHKFNITISEMHPVGQFELGNIGIQHFSCTELSLKSGNIAYT